MKTQFELIATCRDGGSKLFNFEGNTYFLDYQIGSTTQGVIFHGKDNKGLPVNEDLHNKIAPYFLGFARLKKPESAEVVKTPLTHNDGFQTEGLKAKILEGFNNVTGADNPYAALEQVLDELGVK